MYKVLAVLILAEKFSNVQQTTKVETKFELGKTKNLQAHSIGIRMDRK